MASTRNLTVYAGDSYSHEITVVDDEDPPAPVDLSDRTWAAQWRWNAFHDAPVAFTVDTTDAATGVLVISLTAAQTAAMKDGGVWDLQGTYTADSAVETLLAGKVTWIKDVTA